MPARTLEDLAKQAVIRNIDQIDDFGLLPYKVIEDVLAKVRTPQQLVCKVFQTFRDITAYLSRIESKRTVRICEG